MGDENKINNQSKHLNDSLKGWVMIVLTLIFLLLYVATLLGFIEPPRDLSLITRFEPIIFVIIGYYFGRLPAQANENILMGEITRQSHKAEAAQQIKERSEQEREILEEKIRNAKIALSLSVTGRMAEKTNGLAASIDRMTNTNQIVGTAVKILDS